MVTSRAEGVVERARKRSQQAREPAVWYEHEELGFNYRMSNIVAAIGVGQLRHLDAIVAKKRQIFGWYRERLEGGGGIRFMPEASYGRCTRWLTVVEVSEEVLKCGSSKVLKCGSSKSLKCGSSKGAEAEVGRPAEGVMQIIEALERKKIESRPVWKPMHLQPVFRGAKVYGGAVSEHYFMKGLCLPSGAGLSAEDVERVCGIVARTLV